jgi:prepilin-type N-terminal cleavage/methylation domain-containing protein
MLSTLKSKKKNKKGFTLVELVIVIAIIAILAAIAIPTVSNVVDTANINTDKANAQTVELTLKSADAEITAKTRSDIKKDSKVEDVLKAYGVNLDLTKSQSDAKWTYEDNRVYCQKEGGGKNELKNETTLETVITHPKGSEG